MLASEQPFLCVRNDRSCERDRRIFSHVPLIDLRVLMSTLLTELFPIQTGEIPQLHACRVKTTGSPEMNTIGGSLSWEIEKRRPDDETWVWSKSHQRLLADVSCSAEELSPIVEACWESGRDRFRKLDSIVPDPDASLGPETVAEYVAQGLWHEVKYDIFNRLKAKALTADPVHIRRRCSRSPRVVEGHPALQLSVKSEVTHQRTLKQIWDDRPDLPLEGLAVKDNTKDRRPLKGTIDETVGPLSAHRTRLLGFDPPEKMKDLLRSASDDTPVVQVEPFSGRRTYEYVLDALDVIVHPRHYDQLQIPRQVQNKLTLSPKNRAELLRTAVQPLKKKGYVRSPLNSEKAPSVFGTAESIGYIPAVRFGDGAVVEDETISVRSIKEHGSASLPPLDSSSMRLAILKIGTPPNTGGFGGKVQNKLSDLGLESIAGQVFSADPTETDVRAKAQDISTSDFDAALALLPDHRDALYRTWKQETVSRDLPNQVILHGTLGERFAPDNIALGLFAKMGGVPYVLAEPLPYADRVVGLDIGRVPKERSDGTMSVAASTHLYGADGRFLGYRLEEASVEGETIPPSRLRRMFPSEAYEEQRVLVHRDGPFRGQEIQTFQELEQEMDSAFHLVAVRKQGAPRLYELDNDRSATQAPKGSYVRISDQSAHVVSSPPPFEGSTPRPLQVHVRSESLSIEEALHSVLSFSIMHHGSVRPPRLPVSLHYSDSVASRLQDGIRPSSQKGPLPYWL